MLNPRLELVTHHILSGFSIFCEGLKQIPTYRCCFPTPHLHIFHGCRRMRMRTRMRMAVLLPSMRNTHISSSLIWSFSFPNQAAAMRKCIFQRRRMIFFQLACLSFLAVLKSVPDPEDFDPSSIPQIVCSGRAPPPPPHSPSRSW